jgi:hypothetical protein
VEGACKWPLVDCPLPFDAFALYSCHCKDLIDVIQTKALSLQMSCVRQVAQRKEEEEKMACYIVKVDDEGVQCWVFASAMSTIPRQKFD